MTKCARTECEADGDFQVDDGVYLCEGHYEEWSDSQLVFRGDTAGERLLKLLQELN